MDHNISERIANPHSVTSVVLLFAIMAFGLTMGMERATALQNVIQDELMKRQNQVRTWSISQ